MNLALTEQNVFLWEYFKAEKYVKHFIGTNQIDSPKSNGMCGENIGNITKSESNFLPTFAFVDHHLSRGIMNTV